MKLLITGGAGFIGANFVQHTVEAHPGYDVVVVDAFTYAGHRSSLAPVAEQITVVEADICDEAAMDDAIVGCDVVVHFAAESHVDRSIDDPGPFLRTNILGTETLLRMARKHRVGRFHHISTDEVFGALTLDGGLFDEDTPYSPRSPYAASKAASDHLVRAYGDTYGLPFTITNCSNNYGPYHLPEKAIPLFITNALDGKTLPLYGDGRSVRDYLYVTDHCRAIDLVLHSGKEGAHLLRGRRRRTGRCRPGRDDPRPPRSPPRPDRVRGRPAGPRPALRHRRQPDPARNWVGSQRHVRGGHRGHHRLVPDERGLVAPDQGPDADHYLVNQHHLVDQRTARPTIGRLRGTPPRPPR